MKRTVPLLIAAIGGFVLIIASFIPATENWGEKAAIWFDILAAIAFILGGGNLLMSHLRKVSDRAAGWAYSVITVVSFLLMLFLGLFKIGVSPAPNQEFFGSSFSNLALTDLPESIEFSVPGNLPVDAEKMEREIPTAVRTQFSAEDEKLSFRGWMSGAQKSDLMGFSSRVDWQASIDELSQKASPPEGLAGKISYVTSHRALSFSGRMSEEEKKQLLALGENSSWKQAVEELSTKSNRQISHTFKNVPDDFQIPGSLSSRLEINDRTASLTGPLGAGDRNQLTGQFPVARPMSDEQLKGLKRKLESLGNPFNEAQAKAFDGILKSSWSVDDVKDRLNNAGKGKPSPQSPKELLAQQKEGTDPLVLTHPAGEDVELNEAQITELQKYLEDSKMRISELAAALKEAGDFNGSQSGELNSFLGTQPTVGARNKALFIALSSVGSLNKEQTDFLLEEYRFEKLWSSEVYALFKKAHVTKYPWSGKFDEGNSAFGWMYEYVFKPLQATVFALLAFFVASAAFRAFRAKNIEAILLLGTAFIILLGRTFAGVYLTSFLPESMAFFRVENLTVWIMQTINTAGNRAIMIGIALGIASTSLKILLGIDRSYLGTGED